MAFTQGERHAENAVIDARATLRKTQEQPSEQHSWTVLDDPSFRRLLRDGHRAEATTSLLTQLENEE